MKFLQSSWLIILVSCILYLATTAAVLSSVKFEGAQTVIETKLTPDDDPSWRFSNPEFDQWVEDLRQEKAAVDLRKAQLDELENRLQAERQELTTVTQRVAQMQADFEKDVVRLKEQEVKNLKRQAKAIGDMAPENAVAVLDQMSDDDVVRLFAVMKNDQVTLLLETLGKMGKAQTKRAAAISERMRNLLPSDGPASAAAPGAQK